MKIPLLKFSYADHDCMDVSGAPLVSFFLFSMRRMRYRALQDKSNASAQKKGYGVPYNRVTGIPFYLAA